MRKASCLTSPPLPPPRLHQTHQRRKYLSVCGPSSDCFVCLTDAFPIVCGLEARCWATVPVLTIFGRLSRINGDLPTSKHKQVDWPGERSQEFLFLSMECGKCCRVWYEARIIPLSLPFSYFSERLNSTPDVIWTLFSDMGICMDTQQISGWYITSSIIEILHHCECRAYWNWRINE